MFIEWFMQQLADNQLLAAGVGTTIVGWLTYQVRAIPGFMQRHGRYQFTTTLDVTDKEEAFSWLRYWLAEYGKQRNVRHLSATSWYDEESEETKQWCGYAPGRHWVWYRGRPIIVNLSRRYKQMGGSGGGYNEDINLTTYGRSNKVWFELLEEVKVQFKREMKFERVPIHLINKWGWGEMGNVPKRLPETVILGDGIDSLIADIEEFLGAEDWYRRRGIPYKRGYMLYGPPGNGKTTFVRMIASQYQQSIGIVDLTVLDSDSQLMQHFANPPARILLIEDIDHLIDNENVNVSMSGMLNALGGISSPNGVVIIMTTNNPEKLPEKLVRPGRVDVRVEFKNVSQRQAQGMFELFYESAELSTQFAERIEDGVYCAAAIQAHFLKYKHDPALAVSEPITVMLGDEENESETEQMAQLFRPNTS